MIKDVIKQLIIDFQSFVIPNPTPRAYEMASLPLNVRKAFVYIGMRRVGKTWLLYDFMQRLMKDSLTKERILYIDFTDDRLEGITASDLQYILEAYFELYPHLVNDANVYFFFDEIHEVDGFEKFIRRLLDKEKMQIHITGSSAKMLSKEISTLLRGRTIDQKVFPFDFFEFLKNKNILVKTPYSSDTRYLLQHQLQEYLSVGGLPEVTNMNAQQRLEVLQGYINSVVYRDIIERYQLKNINAVKATVHYLVKNSATKLSMHKLYERFKSIGISVSKDSLYEYQAHLEDCFCIFSIPLLTPSITKQQINPKKIYPIDTGFITAYSFSNTMNIAAKLETLVFITLLRTNANIYYYLTEDGFEVDFAILDKLENLTLIQVCVDNLDNPTTNAREIRALTTAMQEQNVAQGYIVTMDVTKTLEMDGKVIKVITLLEFLNTFKQLK